MQKADLGSEQVSLDDKYILYYIMERQYTETNDNYINPSDDNINNNAQMYIINYKNNNLFSLFILLFFVFSCVNICKTINNQRIYRSNQINRNERLQRNQRNQRNQLPQKKK